MDGLNSEVKLRARAAAAVDLKIDLFFRRHVEPVLEPGRIRWWFSLSGGKDSFSMAQGVRRWYERTGVPFTASCFVIDQWGGGASRHLESKLKWPLPLILVEGRALTQEKTGYRAGQQAPCRSCSDARHVLTDALLAQSARTLEGHVDVVARGLHLTDTAVSLLWRHARGWDAAGEMIRLGKARPLVPLPGSQFLAKPFTYVREFESAAYADACGYVPECCGCPACRFPSRRDIVEESLCQFFDGPLWEFEVPGVRDFLRNLGTDEVEGLSVGGVLSKHRHLARDFAAFGVERFRQLAAQSREIWSAQCDPSADLDLIGAARLNANGPLVRTDRLPTPALFLGRPLQGRENWMIATMGPFWGALGLSPVLAAQAWELQEACFGVSLDDRWSQVNALLHEFYAQSASSKKEHVIRPGSRLSGKLWGSSHAI